MCLIAQRVPGVRWSPTVLFHLSWALWELLEGPGEELGFTPSVLGSQWRALS